MACSRRRVSSAKDYENITVVPSGFVDNDKPLYKKVTFNGKASASYKKLNAMRRKNLMCDVSLLTADGGHVIAHKCVLAANSEYFEKMFASGFEESGRRRVHMEWFDSDVLRALIDCIYTLELHITEHNVQYLFHGADFLQLDDVRAACLDYIGSTITPLNCLAVKDIAYANGLDGLYADCLSFALNNFESIVETGGLSETSHEQIVELIRSDELTVFNEETVFDSVLDWVRHDAGHRTRYLDELLGHVRLPLVCRRFLGHRIDSEPLLGYCGLNRLREMNELQTAIAIRRRKPKTKNVILVFGLSGRHTSNAVEFLDVQEGRWRNCASAPSSEALWSACVSLDDGRRLMAVGGVTDDQAKIANDRGEWTAVPASRRMHRRRMQPGVAPVGRRIYTIGGHDVTGKPRKDGEYYDELTGEWHAISSMTSRRDCFGMTVLNGLIYVLGGLGENATVQNSAERYDPETDSWSSIAPMHQRRHSTMVCTLNGLVSVVGGSCHGIAMNCAEVYCPETNVWTQIASMNTPRYLGSAVTLDGLMYVIGGCSRMHVLLDTFETYDPCTDSWTVSGAKLNTGSWFNRAIVLDRNHGLLKRDSMDV